MKNKLLQLGILVIIVLTFIVGCDSSKNDDLYSEEFVKSFLSDYYVVTKDDKDRVATTFDVEKIVNDNFFEDYHNQMITIYEGYLAKDLLEDLVAIRALDNVDKYAFVEDKEISVKEINLSLSKEDLTSNEEIRFLYDYHVKLEVSKNDINDIIVKEGKVRVYKTENNWLLDYIDFEVFPVQKK